MSHDSSGAAADSRPVNAPGEQEIRSWFIGTLAEKLAVPRAEIDTTVPFAELGLTSLQGVRMSDELGRWLGIAVSAGVVFDFPTIDLLARHLAEAIGEGDSAEAPDLGDEGAEESLEDLAELLRLLDEDAGGDGHGETD
ncbi:acyl carrier protein [Nocardia sp. NBC_00508]|uniref:acyl carrier protein n=1 Tax=Nocardia sp. NBC_00508 TaxID=2975992 RepID=UPI002E823ADB|nr:acyl carrier protein [Nocardia sp. NBC_00508]WUD66568.1 acyl carrier protein [Nocardia sp. NBC_00508]